MGSKKLTPTFQEQVLQAFDALGTPTVAVRSSATSEDSAQASWAGQLDTFLHTDRAHVIKNIQKCWASVHSKRALAYAQQLNIEPGEVAVIVQQMIPSAVSGVAFSLHPVTNDVTQLIIEAALGLGEAVVSGQITPDLYIVEKHSLKLLQKQVAVQDRKLHPDNTWQQLDPPHQTPKLTDQQIKALARTVVAIERHFGFPVDVEWAWADKQFFITQSRPITTHK